MAKTNSPRHIFDNPEQYLDLLTLPNDRDFEGQLFDRKEVPRAAANGAVRDNDLKAFKNDHIVPVLSGFANQNHDGGLLVLGISTTGQVVGINHLNENQINSLAQITYIVNHKIDFKIHEVVIEGSTLQIGLFFSGYVDRAICETSGSPKRAWRRSGLQNLELTDIEIETMKRDKVIVSFERTNCSRYNAGDVDTDVYKEYSSTHLDNATYKWSTTDLLKHLGAILKMPNDELWFTNAGALFFGVNPEKDIPQAFIRLLRFDVPYSEHKNRPGATYDKKFSGSITKQIRDFRTFISESAFFEVYQRRNPTGGFIEEPEYPTIAVDEAVVNAVAHRDYAIGKPIFCIKYTDAFVVVSPGGIIQSVNVPEHFSLDNTHLEHHSRNPQLMNWLRDMRDANGRAFVQALQEGTRRMRDEMAKLGLSAPEYTTTPLETRVVLYNNSATRKETSFAENPDSPEFTNLYPFKGVILEPDHDKKDHQKREIILALKNKMSASGWFVDRHSFGLIIGHRRGMALPSRPAVSQIVQLFPAYIFQIKEYRDQLFLLVDYTVEVQTVLPLQRVLNYISKERVIDMRCICQFQGWSHGKLVAIENDYCKVFIFDTKTEEILPITKVIPKLPQEAIKQVFAALGVQYDLPKEIKKATFATDKNASRLRADVTRNVVIDIFENIFPLKTGSSAITISTEPLRMSPRGDGSNLIRVDGLKEPQVEFSKHKASSDVREGITQYGSYDNSPKNIEIIPLCASNFQSNMQALIDRLRAGKFKYKGSERTFGVKLTYNTVINADPNNLQKEIDRLLEQHPEWKGDKTLSRIFLVHCPEAGHSIDDEASPYYVVKRMLLEAGIPCQMVDTPTLLNPDFKDLNLALNIVAKCGQTPWVLPESIPDCDFFIGLSYTQNYRKGSHRVMAFANVFNEYGRWEFYSGGSEVFAFEDRVKHYEALVKATLSKLKLSEEPTICFHYSAKFSREDKAAILKAARSIRLNGTYVFVWINSHHHVRLYDDRPETSGSLTRGRYVITRGNQILLSTTGDNPYRRALGTPKPLELNIFIEAKNNTAKTPDLRVLASQVLSLTKLNWASTDSHCAEPITTKYAGDIAYLTGAFMRQGGDFKLHPALERTPWFL
jgi:predicted HTH transcriptional regulator